MSAESTSSLIASLTSKTVIDTVRLVGHLRCVKMLYLKHLDVIDLTDYSRLPNGLVSMGKEIPRKNLSNVVKFQNLVEKCCNVCKKVTL
jgi:hypothetical protein